ncbi:MAG TPA: hypothetical protein VH761_14980 [Ilumatobacteraceae bacterium]
MAGTNLFPDEPEFTPRPAYQVIEAARRLGLTGELTLGTTPPTRVYLRDGVVYFAERTTDGTLAIRLLVEGVINREQMQRGTVIVNGVEHVGRMFEADPSIDRASVELCTELFTDDVMIDVADRPVDRYNLVLYKRHPSGIDRWYPNSVTSKHGEPPPAEPEPVPAAQPAATVHDRPQPLETTPVFERPAAPSMPAMPAIPAMSEIPLSDIASMPDVAVAAEIAPPLPMPAMKSLAEIQAEPQNSLNAPPITLAVPVTKPAEASSSPTSTQPLPITPLVTSSVPVIKPFQTQPTAQIPAVPKAPPAPEADAATIADEVAEAIKRAFSGLGAGT